MKTTVVIIIILLIIVGAFALLGRSSTTVSTITPTPTPTSDAIDMCYYFSEKTARGFFDRAWVKMAITGSNVTGEFYNLPAETDSKVGTFSGTVGAMNPATSSRRADLVWTARAEGTENKEQLFVDFGEGSAVAYFGEMIPNPDGTYSYKDPANLFPSRTMSQIDCDDLAELQTVEKYVRENITTIATDKAVLGGAWAVMTVNVVPSTNSGEVVYEDGHVQSKATFTYTFDPATNKISIVNFTKK